MMCCKLCIEGLGLVLVGVPEERWWSLALWVGSSLDPECGLYEVVVGGQGGCGVGGDVELWCG